MLIAFPRSMLRSSSAVNPQFWSPAAVLKLLPNGKSVPKTICEVETRVFKAVIWIGLVDPAVS